MTLMIQRAAASRCDEAFVPALFLRLKFESQVKKNDPRNIVPVANRSLTTRRDSARGHGPMGALERLKVLAFLKVDCKDDLGGFFRLKNRNLR